ncbi:hypothetical protein U9M48_025036 [Paspalum notatum var. saurae]|uniref:Uncharacterized protein n=1 Tax=Paspalum notatum var. saurae TaxID=547442 RepID=A0AAQ3WXK1_PASNO
MPAVARPPPDADPISSTGRRPTPTPPPPDAPVSRLPRDADPAQPAPLPPSPLSGPSVLASSKPALLQRRHLQRSQVSAGAPPSHQAWRERHRLGWVRRGSMSETLQPPIPLSDKQDAWKGPSTTTPQVTSHACCKSQQTYALEDILFVPAIISGRYFVLVKKEVMSDVNVH